MKQRVRARMSLGEGAYRIKYLTGIPVLKELTVPLMPAVKTDSISSEQSPHYS
ncbi:MAG: hypothetical protein KAV83_11440 [Desulfobacterales bacterium]|nr:hypothetical protein [Desulfobacterales bacterium]